MNIVVTDDGRGMDPERLADKAVEKGLLSREQANALTRHEALMLVCAPGFSTAETVSDISGRGVGMDAVRVAVQALGGGLDIESDTGRGSTFPVEAPHFGLDHSCPVGGVRSPDDRIPCQCHQTHHRTPE